MDNSIFDKKEKRERQINLIDEVLSLEIDKIKLNNELQIVKDLIECKKRQYISFDIIKSLHKIVPDNINKTTEVQHKEDEDVDDVKIIEDNNTSDSGGDTAIDNSEKRRRRTKEEVQNTLTEYNNLMHASKERHDLRIKNDIDTLESEKQFSQDVLEACENYKKKCSASEYKLTISKIRKAMPILEDVGIFDIKSRGRPLINKKDNVDEQIAKESITTEKTIKDTIKENNEKKANEIKESMDNGIEVTYNLVNEQWFEDLTPQQLSILCRMGESEENSIDNIILESCITEGGNKDEVINNTILLSTCPDIDQFGNLKDTFFELADSVRNDNENNTKELVESINVFLPHIKKLLSFVAVKVKQSQSEDIPF